MKVFDYLHFRLKAKNEYNIHSPFLFDLYNNTLKEKNSFSFINSLSDIKHLSSNRKSNSYLPFDYTLPKRYTEVISRLFQRFQFTSLLKVSFKDNAPFYTLYSKDTSSNHFIKVKESITLSSIMEIIPTPEMVFLDRGYTIDGIDSVLNELLPYLSKDSIFIFEELHSQKENYSCWDKILYFKEITLSLDIYFLGILLFNNSLSKQHFELKI